MADSVCEDLSRSQEIKITELKDRNVVYFNCIMYIAGPC